MPADRVGNAAWQRWCSAREAAISHLMSNDADEPKRAERGKQVTAGYMERVAVYYLERYSSSS